jgi:hypothetical protein
MLGCMNQTEYVNHLVEKFIINGPKIDFDSATVDAVEEQIPANRFPPHYNVTEGKSYPKSVYVYYLPLTGMASLLRYRPNPYIMWSSEVSVDSNNLQYRIISFNDNPEEVRNEFNQFLSNFKRQMGNMTTQVDNYNANLKSAIEQELKKRKDAILRRRNALASLGVPFKKRDDVPQTYSIPTPQFRKSVNVKPEAATGAFKPDPTLDNNSYQDILKTIHDVGKVFERLPSTYKDRSEDNLRDLLLLYLEPRYYGTAGGETFNSHGKTDILIRYQNENAFIAECKFWQGRKHFLETISDQLLKYLTWRDSKAAMIIFVKNKEITAVLKEIEEAAPTHSNYLGFVDKKDDSWFNYRFHIIGDSNKEVKLAILVFHFP